MSSKKVKKIILIAVGMLCALICAACGVFLYQFYRGAQSKTALAQQVKTAAAPAVSQKPAKDTSADTQEPSVPDTAPAEEEPTVLPVEIPIDFTQLAAVSPDIYAWLEVPDTQIDEPVLQHSGDDLYYNSHNAYGEYYMCGAVFSQETYNDRTFDAPMTILYGHGTVLGQPGAFHELNSYAEQDYFDMHRQMFVYTPSAMYVYRVLQHLYTDGSICFIITIFPILQFLQGFSIQSARRQIRHTAILMTAACRNRVIKFLHFRPASSRTKPDAIS